MNFLPPHPPQTPPSSIRSRVVSHRSVVSSSHRPRNCVDPTVSAPENMTSAGSCVSSWPLQPVLEIPSFTGMIFFLFLVDIIVRLMDVILFGAG
ncbi:hypothetical protein EX30DRAFT_341860 [Ascodesmis nigricans]|uniref:Uncharacterized protein n=1 Tax=Ascodesmis nigricans TaxID=341454 RepID=A0A4S2MU22_9PEZI|nr:hypothetical protein EX30DRAFT_341860 [Ascodesmis nigricans]